MSENTKPEEKIILFPGNQMPFSRKFLPYQIFSFNKEKTPNSEKYFLFCMKPVILYPKRIPKSSKSKPKEKENNINKESEE